jgi:excisionase family DNA binding protein
MDDFMTSAQAARLLGVGPSSVKRWADQGLLPCLKTAGHHRRFARAEIERFRLTRGSQEGGWARQVDEWVGRLLSDTHPYELHSSLLQERARQGAWWAVAALMGNVLVELGQRWQRGQIDIVDEHLATERLARAIARCVEGMAVPADAPNCLLATAVDDDHTLGLALAELCLRASGWRTCWVGRKVPTSELAERMAREPFAMLGLSCAEGHADPAALAEQVRQLAAVCRDRGARLLLGGSGPWPEPNAELDGFVRIKNFRELEGLLRGPHAA